MDGTATEIVTAFMEALEAKEFDKAAMYLSDNFQFSGSTPLPLNKDKFISYSSALATGMPNLSYHFHDLQEVAGRLGEGNRVKAAIQITGTQTNSFQVVVLGFPPIPETNKSVLLPVEHWDYAVKGNTIALTRVEQVSGGGITGILEQLGIDIPIVQ
jgi:predicted SnoaL-like aldol condensation-catalyzing enzyme